MRLDYSEKRGGREGVERKPVQKNRPRKEPVGMFVLLSVLALTVTFGAGVVTGWFFFKAPRNAPAVAAAQPVKKEVPAPAPVQPGPEAPLTFYNTLPAGGKGVIGSGLNLKKPEPAPSAPRPAALADPAAPAAPAALKPQADKQENQLKQDSREKQAKPEKQESQEKQDKPEVRYLVQVASYRDKQEADAAQARLTGKGVAAYVVESRFPDKTVWYRLRIGRHLTRAEAGQIAGKTGKGAVVIAE